MTPFARLERRGHSPVTNVDTLTEVGMERSGGRDQRRGYSRDPSFPPFTNKWAFANRAKEAGLTRLRLKYVMWRQPISWPNVSKSGRLRIGGSS